VTLAWHKARACKVCAPSSVALASIELALARACAGAVQSTGSTRGTSPHPCRQWREQRTWGARGAHPRTPALLQADDLPGSKTTKKKDATRTGRAVLSRVGVMAFEYSFILLALTSQRSRPPSSGEYIEILGLPYLDLSGFWSIAGGVMRRETCDVLFALFIYCLSVCLVIGEMSVILLMSDE